MDRFLLLLLLTPLLAGCLDAPPEGAAEEETSREVTVRQDALPRADPDCQRVSTNFGIWVEADGHYVVPNTEGPRVAYRESNGISGLQTEESCPGNPDEKLA